MSKAEAEGELRYQARPPPRPPPPRRPSLPSTHTHSHFAHLAERLRQRVRLRGAPRRAPARSEQSESLPVRPLRGADHRQRLHRPARDQPPLLALPRPPLGHARALRAALPSARAPHGRLFRLRGDAEPAPVAPAAAARPGGRFRPRPDHRLRRRLGRDALRRGRPHLRRLCRHGRRLPRQRRRRPPPRPAARRAVHYHRVWAHARRAGRGRRPPARRALLGRAARRRRARL